MFKLVNSTIHCSKRKKHLFRIFTQRGGIEESSNTFSISEARIIKENF